MRLEEWLLLGLSRTAQYVIALIMLGLSTWAYLNDWIWPWGWIIGFVLLCWSCFGPKRQREDRDDLH